VPSKERSNLPPTLAKMMEDAEARRRQIRTKREEAARAGRSLYSNDQGEPILRESIAVYLDALGTKAALHGLTDEDLRAGISLNDELAWFLHDPDMDNHARVLAFSDNVISGAPVDELEDDGGLFSAVFDVASYQLNMTLRGRLLRGGIARGPLYMDHSYVTGEALLFAYDLESRVASFPRVLIHETTWDGLSRGLQNGGEEWYSSAYNRYLSLDSDGEAFVNYLAGLTESVPDVEVDVPAGMRLHSEFVSNKLVEFGSEPSIRDKYVWCAHYHNWMVEEFFNDFSLPVVDGLTEREKRNTRSFRLLIERPS
jgi:hypothetical protein